MSELWLLGTSRRIVDDIISENVGIFNDKFMSGAFISFGGIPSVMRFPLMKFVANMDLKFEMFSFYNVNFQDL